MRRRNVILLAVVCLLVEPCFIQASVIIKTAPHASVKMEFGAQHVPPHDVALLDESAKVDGTTRLGIEVPHSHNHRNILIHKIGTYLTVVMKALAKTVAPSQNQDGKTHFDIHVDADLGENDSKDKKHESPQFTIVHSKHEEGEEQVKGDCVKAVVIMSESENDDKKAEHKSSEKHSKDDHKKKDSHIVLHYSGEDSKDYHKEDLHKEHSKEDHKKKDTHIVLHYSGEDSKDSKDYHKEDHKEYSKEDHKKKDTHIVLHYSGEDSKDSKDYHKEDHKEYSKEDHKKKDTHIVFHYSGEDSKDSKENHQKHIHKELEGKIHISKEKHEEKKDDKSDAFKLQAPKDWESFKKTQEMLKEKGFILQLDKSFFFSEENKGKSSQKVQTLDIKKNVKYSQEGKSLSEEEMEEGESERNWKSLELTEADPEEMWISMVNPTDVISRYQIHPVNNEDDSENNYFSKTEAVHTSSVGDSSKGSKQIQTMKTTYHSGEGPVIVTTTKSVTEVPPKGDKAVGFEVMKQTSMSEKLIPPKAQHDPLEMSFTTNEIPSHISSHFQQTSYSTDRTRAITIASQDPTKGVVSQPAVFQVKDKLTEKSESSKAVPHLKKHDDSREVIMRLAPASKIGATKKSQINDVKKVKVIKPNISDEAATDDIPIRQESIRKLPMANIPTLIDVLQNSPPQEVQRLTQLASGGTSQESKKDYSSAEVENSQAAPTNISDPSSSKSPREFQLPDLHVSNLNLEERKNLRESAEDLTYSAPTDYKETYKTARNEKSHTDPEIHIPTEEGIVEVRSEKSIGDDPDSASKAFEITKKGNFQDHQSAEEPRSLKYILDNPSILKSVEVSVTIEPDRQQKELVIDSLNADTDQNMQNNANANVNHEGERNQKTFRNDLKKLEEDNKADGTFLTKPAVVEDVGIDSSASHALTLCSLTTSAEEARALDISSPQLENQPAEAPVPNGAPVEESAHSPRNLNQEPEVYDTAEKNSEEARLGKHTSPSLPEEETEHKEESVTDEAPSIKDKSAADDEPKETTSSDIHSVVLPAYDDSTYAVPSVTEPSTIPFLPEQESMSLPAPKERELTLEDEANTPVSNLAVLNEGVQLDEDRDGRIYDSRLDSNSLVAPPSQHTAVLPETSALTAVTPLNNDIHDPKSPYIYSYYPAFYPKGVYATQNKTEETQGLYGKPSPRVICVSTDTGKVVGGASNVAVQSNSIVKYSDVSKSSKEDDKLMLLKLLHEDIQKLKQQLKIQ